MVTVDSEATNLVDRRRVIRRACPLFAAALGLSLCQCGALNPAFINLIDTSGTAQFSTLDNAPGHVIIAFVNNAVVDEALLSFLQSSEGGSLVLTDAERRALRPRIRARVRVTFADGSSQVIEYVDGSSKLVDSRFDARTFADLTGNDLGNTVVLCDVASVTLDPGSEVEVFVPVEVTGFDLVETTNASGGVVTTFQPRTRIQPQFLPLRVDDVDADGNVTVLRNVGTRDVPTPVNNPVCGSVVAIAVNGTLSVPFLTVASTAPSFDQADAQQAGSVGGRFSFQISIK